MPMPVDTCRENGVCTNVPVGCPAGQTCDADKGEHVPEGPVAGAYVGSAKCGECPSSTHESFMLTGHPFKLNAVVDAKLRNFRLRNSPDHRKMLRGPICRS